MKLEYDIEDDLTKFIQSKDALYHFTGKDKAIEPLAKLSRDDR